MELYGRVSILPKDLVGDIDFKIVDATKVEYENKPYVSPTMGQHSNTEDGDWSSDPVYIMTVIKIIDRKPAPFIRDEIGNDCGRAIFDVKFQAKVLKLLPDDIITAQVLAIQRLSANSVNIFAKNNQILAFMNNNHIDKSIFALSEKGEVLHKITGKSLAEGDYIQIRVIQTDIQLNNSSLKVIGYLQDII